MAKTLETEQLERLLWRRTVRLGVFGCFEVTIGWYGDERVDYMTYDTKGIVRCYEIKTSLSDFNSKAKLSFVGNYNYYALTPDLYEKVKDKIPDGIGAFVGGEVVKKSKKRDLSCDKEILLSSMIRSMSRDVNRAMQCDIDHPSNSKTAKQMQLMRRELSTLREKVKHLEESYKFLQIKYLQIKYLQARRGL